jgi:hypothetical protein
MLHLNFLIFNFQIFKIFLKFWIWVFDFLFCDFWFFIFEFRILSFDFLLFSFAHNFVYLYLLRTCVSPTALRGWWDLNIQPHRPDISL